MAQVSARNCAMDLLSRREHSRTELSAKLQQRRFPQSEIDEALDGLQRENLQSDQRFAENFVYQRVRKGLGPVRIRHELRDRGIVDEVIQALLAEQDGRWAEAMQQQREKKFGTDMPLEYKEKMKQARFLQNRGFSPESVMRLFR